MAKGLQAQIEAAGAEREKLSAVLQQMNSGVVMVDQYGRIQLINHASEDIFAVLEADVIGKTLVEIFRNHQIVEIWKESQATGEGQLQVLDLPNLNRTLEVLVSPLGYLLEGHSLLLFQDMTRLRMLETVRQDFISNISHELRTPLASLKALTETLLEGALDDPPASRRFLTRIETEVDSLALIVQELLELSLIEFRQGALID